MDGYFKPLRHKIGMLTLVLACVFTGGWVRSNFCRDAIAWEPGPLAIGVISGDSMIGIGAGIFRDQFEWVLPIFDTSDFIPYADELECQDMKWNLAGIRLGTSKEPPPATEVMYIADIPYPYAAIPLTLLTAWLLLSKLKSVSPAAC